MLAPAVLAHRSADIFGYSKAASLYVTETDRRQALEDVFETLDAAESIVFLDTEATGNGEQARLIEVGMVEKSPEGELIGGMNFHCNPHRRSSGGARRVHGIADCELEHCREFAWYAKDLREALTGKVVVIHDPTNDIRWLNKEYRLLDPNAAPIESLCTVSTLIRSLRGCLPSDAETAWTVWRLGMDLPVRRLSIAPTAMRICCPKCFLSCGGIWPISFGRKRRLTPPDPVDTRMPQTRDCGIAFWAVSTAVAESVGVGSACRASAP